MMFRVNAGGGYHIAHGTEDESAFLLLEGSALAHASTVRLPQELGGHVVRIVALGDECACGGGHPAAELAAQHDGKPLRVSDCGGQFRWFVEK